MLRSSVILLLLVLAAFSIEGFDVWLLAPVRAAGVPTTLTIPPTALLIPTRSATPARRSTSTATATPTATATLRPSFTPTPTETATSTPSPSSTPTPTLYPPDLPTAPAYLDNTWQTLPVIPEIDESLRARLQAIYARGQARGVNPQAFSKVGDCNSESEFFLFPFDTPDAYTLGEYGYLQTPIDHFQGSFARASLAARTGFGPSAMFDSTWTDPALCGPDEGPLPCEFRLHRPSLVLVGLGTHYVPQAQFESQLRRVIEYSLEQGVVPILATKVDTEGGDRVNALVAWLAQQYQVPLWNFWRAAQPLWNQGQPDGIHFTWASNDFSSAYALRHGWPVRNLTALQALAAVWEASASPRAASSASPAP